MARTLPWLKGSSRTAKRKSTSASNQQADALPSKRRRVPSPVHSEFDTPGLRAARKCESTSPSRRARELSSSPVPAPPDITFMTRHDDVWIMVEDEFYTTAQLFTRHLHHAEYKRLKRRTAQANTDPNKIIGGATMVESQKRKLNAEHVVRIHSGAVVKRSSEDEEAGDDVIIEDRRLAGLMFANGTDSRIRTKLDDLAGGHVISKTRAAAGFGKQREASHRPAPMLAQEWHMRHNQVDSLVRGPPMTPSVASTMTAETISDDEDLDALPARAQPLQPPGGHFQKEPVKTKVAAAALDPPLDRFLTQRDERDPAKHPQTSSLIPRQESSMSLRYGTQTMLTHTRPRESSPLASSPKNGHTSPRSGPDTVKIREGTEIIPLDDDDDDDGFPNKRKADPRLDDWRKARAARLAAKSAVKHEDKSERRPLAL